MTTPQIKGFDKIKYGVANFCKAIGIKGIANYFMKTISPDTLVKIHDIEKLVATSMKMNELLRNKTSKESITSKRVENVQSKVAREIDRRAQIQKGNHSII